MASFIALDVGTKRIGVAAADTSVPIAMPLLTLEVDGTEVQKIRELVQSRKVEKVIVGFPRNQFGGATDQTALTEKFADKLRDFADVYFQDESLTSVMAEERLRADGRKYSKADVDAMAATIILQDYLEENHASS